MSSPIRSEGEVTQLMATGRYGNRSYASAGPEYADAMARGDRAEATVPSCLPESQGSGLIRAYPDQFKHLEVGL
jgi:hypothetical protein